MMIEVTLIRALQSSAFRPPTFVLFLVVICLGSSAEAANFSVGITSPSGGTTWTTGNPVSVSWNTVGPKPDHLAGYRVVITAKGNPSNVYMSTYSADTPGTFENLNFSCPAAAKNGGVPTACQVVVIAIDDQGGEITPSAPVDINIITN